MDMDKAIAPKSDQLNAEDLLTGPRVFTVSEVELVDADQPVNVHLVETPGRAYRPSKSMRRVLVNAWGKDSSQWAGRSLKLFRNPTIKFGADVVGGIEISEVSHINKPVGMPLTVTRGKRKTFVVKPLQVVAPAQEQNAISPRTLADGERAVAQGKVPEFIAWLKGEGAPAFVLDWAASLTPKPEAEAQPAERQPWEADPSDDGPPPEEQPATDPGTDAVEPNTEGENQQ